MLYKQHASMHEAYLPKVMPCIWSEIQHLNVKQVQLLNTQAYAPLAKFTKIEILKLMYEFLILWINSLKKYSFWFFSASIIMEL